MIITPTALVCIGFLGGLLLHQAHQKYQTWKFSRGLERSAKILAQRSVK